MFEILTAGAVFGLSGGLSPGPLLALVVSETLNRGRAAGLAVAAAPLVSDGPIIAATIYLLGRIENSQPGLGILSLAGGAVLASYGIAALRTVQNDFEDHPNPSRLLLSLGKGVTVNLLNPSPYLFWLTIGTPLLLKAWATSALVTGLFLGFFYTGLVGSKSVLAVLVARSRSVLLGARYRWVMRALALVLFVYAAYSLPDQILLS